MWRLAQGGFRSGLIRDIRPNTTIACGSGLVACVVFRSPVGSDLSVEHRCGVAVWSAAYVVDHNGMSKPRLLEIEEEVGKLQLGTRQSLYAVRRRPRLK